MIKYLPDISVDLKNLALANKPRRQRRHKMRIRLLQEGITKIISLLHTPTYNSHRSDLFSTSQHLSQASA